MYRVPSTTYVWSLDVPFALFPMSGSALTDGEDRVHGHVLAGVFNLPSKHVAGDGGLNFDGAKQGPTHEFLNSSLPATSGYPFLQLTTCRLGLSVASVGVAGLMNL